MTTQENGKNGALVFLRCGGCGREIDIQKMSEGDRCLCSRCHHLLVYRPRTGEGMSHRTFTVLVTVSLAIIALAGFSLCFLYLFGTGRVSWFFPLFASMLLVVSVPAYLFSRRRNLSLIAASLYLPLALWSFLWSLAPGVDWEYPGSMGWSAVFILSLAAMGFYLYGRDLRTLSKR